jgi:hypothetical protein
MKEPTTKRRRVTEPKDSLVKGSDTIQRGINEFLAKIKELEEELESEREEQRIQIQKMESENATQQELNKSVVKEVKMLNDQVEKLYSKVAFAESVSETLWKEVDFCRTSERPLRPDRRYNMWLCPYCSASITNKKARCERCTNWAGEDVSLALLSWDLANEEIA